MRGILFGALGAIALLIGGTMYAAFREAGANYHAAVDRCHDAGGAWLPDGPRSYAGQCLTTSTTRPHPPITPRPAPDRPWGPAP